VAAQAERPDPTPHPISIDAEPLTRVRLVAARAIQCLHEQLALDFLEVHSCGRESERDGVTT
jgi:hypothetical protein